MSAVATVAAPPRSFKVACMVSGEEKPAYNAMRYSTREAAQSAGDNLFMRWTALKSFSVEPSDEEPNDSK